MAPSSVNKDIQIEHTFHLNACLAVKTSGGDY